MRTRHARGSAIILVAVTLALMAMLGAAYIQLARVDRMTSLQAKRTGQIDAAVQGAISQIQSVLRNDLLDDSGNFFNPTPPADTTDPNDLNAGGGDEPYDYPHTGPMPASSLERWKVNFLDGTQADAAGGQFDDTWLASTTPDFTTPSAPEWPHITNLNGVFLHNGTDADLTTLMFPVEEAVTNTVATPETWDTNLGVASGYLVDADGDGVPDSRWTWAPIPKAGNVMYVMAVRIIDNSSLINVNVALSQVDSTGAYDTSASGTDAPRWSSPSELDLGAFINKFTAYNNRMTELEDLIDYRLGGTLSSPSLPRVPWGSTTGERHDFWVKGARLYGQYTSGYQSLTIQDELELRYRNGLNNADRKLAIETDVDLDPNTTGNQSGLYTVLRQDVSQSESHYIHFVDGIASAIPSTHDPLKIKDFFEQEPRHQITTRSGAAVFASPLPGETGQQLKSDLNAVSATTLSADIKKVLDADPGGGTTYTHPLGWTTQEVADQFAACIEDYADSDNHLTAVGSAGSERYGMEALPFVTEVYVQGRYEVTSATENPPASGIWDLTWTLQGVPGYAIEIRNPFRKPILLTDVNLWVNDVDWGTLDTLAGQTTLDMDGVLILYRNSRDTASGDDDVAALWNVDPSTTAVELTSHSWPAMPNTFDIELRATDNGGTPLIWSYVTASSEIMPATINQSNVSSVVNPSVAPAVVDYRQRTTRGNGNGINILTIKKSEFTVTFKDPVVLPPSPPRDTSIDTLGEVIKGGPADKVNPTANQILIADYTNGKIVQVGELAHIAAIGPDATKTVADMWGSATDVKDFMLDFSSSNLVDTGVDSMAVPHAAIMLDRFTTLSPAVDGEDNDGDGVIDNPEEQLIPGTINLNTIAGLEEDLPANPGTYVLPSDHLLSYVLPISDPSVRDNILTAILKYRDQLSPFTGANRSRSNPGIANIGELMRCVDPSSSDSIDALTKSTPPDYSGDTRALANGTVVDFLNPDATTPDGIADDREEEVMVARWLAQVCSTRSDIFTAYVLIQGYPADDFTKGPVESIRFFAVLDRSGVVDQNSPVRVLGVYRMH